MKFLFLVLTITVASCATAPKRGSSRDYQLGAYLWQQRSGEYRALSYQAYNLARMNLERDLQNKHNKKRAVIFDIDETVLDNSFGGAREVKENIDWSPTLFSDWVKKIAAETVPGAREFIDFAFSNQVEVIYISNRTVDQIDDTLANFKKLGIKAKKENMIFMRDEWGKESRRVDIFKKFEVVMLIGDNLHDFNKIFGDKTADERKELVDQNRQLFGTSYIILPNPLYGDWEKSLPKVQDKRELLIPR